MLAEQRPRILRAATELIAKRGYHHTTIELIIRRAHVSYATFYKHFDNREQCFLALFDEANEETMRRVRVAFDGEEVWPEKIAAGLSAFFGAIAEDPATARACLVEALTAGPAAVAHYEAALAAFEPFLREGRELTPRGARLPKTLESTLTGAVGWAAYQRLVVGEAAKLPAQLPETLELLLSPYIGEEAAVKAAGSAAAVPAS